MWSQPEGRLVVTQEQHEVLTRRSLVAGGLASLAALVASAIGKPASVLAADGDPMLVGEHNNASTTTHLHCDGDAFTALRVASASVAVWAETNSNGGGAVAVLGGATAPTGQTYGVQGQSMSAEGRGVWGLSPGTGVYGESDNVGIHGVSGTFNGMGIWAESTAGSGGTALYARSVGDQGRSVYAIAWGVDAYAVYANASDPTGTGVVGRNSSLTGSAAGVYGENVSPQGTGVLGLGGANGIKGKAHKSTGTGVRGEGGAFGVWGATELANGVGVRGDATSGNGVEGVAGGPGGNGVFGSSSGGGNGVVGTAESAVGAGVLGFNAGIGPAVRGDAPGGIGVRGIATSGTGGSFEATSGKAIHAIGALRFDGSSGLTTIRAGERGITIPVSVPLSTRPKVLATLQTDGGGKASIARAQASPALGAITIFLTEKATKDCSVAWLILS
jgi:hypothetical protein